MKPIIKLVIAVLLLLCLADMPYGFYSLVRFAAAAVFAYYAYDSFKTKENGKGFLFVALSLLFQPFVKIALGRTMWNVVDVIVAFFLIFLVYKIVNK